MYYLGIDLGGTNVAAGVVDSDCNIIAKTSVSTNANKGVDAIVNAIAAAARNAVDRAGISFDNLQGVGIGSPGAITPATGTVDFAANLGFVNTPLTALVKEKIPCKNVYIENDANVAALAESRAGAAKGAKDSITVTLGTGVGGGIIIDGKIYSGFNGKGAEIGHMVINRNGVPCTCGRNGCWEAYASVSALIRITKEYMEKDRLSKMWELTNGDISRVNGLTSFDGMRAGDKSATAAVHEYLDSVAAGIVNMINILQPEVICIGGGISKEGDTLLIPIKERVASEVFTKNSSSTTDIRIAKLGNDAGIIGAAMLAL